MTGSILLFLFGCASSPRPARHAPGYSETPLAPDVFRIVYNGSAASPEQNLDLTLLRACQVARAESWSYFAVVDEDSSVTNQIMYCSGLNGFVLKPERGLVIRCFSSRPKRIFSYKAEKLEKVLDEKINPLNH